MIRRWLIGTVGVPLAVALAMGAVVTAIQSPLALFACSVAVLALGILTIGRTLTGPAPVDGLPRVLVAPTAS
jgi:hypothetical protein